MSVLCYASLPDVTKNTRDIEISMRKIEHISEMIYNIIKKISIIKNKLNEFDIYSDRKQILKTRIKLKIIELKLKKVLDELNKITEE
jgi:hypothetical protein